MKKITYILVIISFLMCSKNKENQHTEFNDWLDSKMEKKDFSENIFFLDSLLKIENYSGDELGIVILKKGGQYAKNAIFPESVKQFKKSITIFTKTRNEYLITKSNYHLGTSYVFLGENQKATQHLLTALEFAKKRGDENYEALTYSSFAHLYYASKDFQKSIEYLHKEAEIQKDKESKSGMSASYNNLAINYKNMMDLETAILYNNLSLEISEEIKDDFGKAKTYNNLGQIYELLYTQDSAIPLYNKAIKINSKNEIHNTTPLKNLSKIYLDQHKYDSVISLSIKAIKIEKNNKKLRDFYSQIIFCYKEKNNLELQEKYSYKLDSVQLLIEKSDNEEKIHTIENLYKASASEQELIQTKKNNEKNRIILIFVFGLLILLGLLLYQRNKNSILKLAKEKLVLEQKVLRSQMNPHFIFNALSAIQNSLLDNEPIKTASYLSKFAKLIRQNFDFINQQFISLSEEIDSLSNYMDTQKLRFEDKFDYEFHLDVNLEEAKIPPLLLQPLVENSIEHGFKNKKEKGLITIKITEDPTKINYLIIDNGNGFDPTKKDNKEHALDVFKKRLKLIGEEESSSFKTNSNNKETSISFSLKKL